MVVDSLQAFSTGPVAYDTFATRLISTEWKIRHSAETYDTVEERKNDTISLHLQTCEKYSLLSVRLIFCG